MHLKWPGFNEKGTVIIQLSPEDFYLREDSIDVDGEIFTAKEELHITVIGTEVGLILQKKIQQEQSDDKLLKKIFEAIDWSFRSAGPVHMLSRTKDSSEQKSIIMLLEMPALCEFYGQLKYHGFIARETPVPPPHVTLYTRNGASGIGVASNEALKLLTLKILSPDAVNKFCNDSLTGKDTGYLR